MPANKTKGLSRAARICIPKKVIKAAITSAHTSGDALGHILFSGESGYGKTTLAQIVAEEMNSKITIITGYALSKPADMVSLLNSL